MIQSSVGSNKVRAGQWRQMLSQIAAPRIPDKAVVVAANQSQAVLGALAHAASRTGELLIASPERCDDQLVEELRDQGFNIVRGLGEATQEVQPPTATRPAASGAIWLLTSGSTGRPKQVRHNLVSLTTVTQPQPPRTWLCAYTPGAYAWWQMMTLLLKHPGTNVVCVEYDELGRWPSLAQEHGVTAVSGTPTFWRQAMWMDAPGLATLALEQITLGGEPVDQPVLDSLRSMFPEARISWIYASSEAGAAIAVHDGRAGFPVEWLGRDEAGRPTIGVVDDELVLTSPFASVENPELLRTGDRVEIAEGRVKIVGRLKSDEVNVGGAKVSLSSVREGLISHPSIAWAAVRGRRAPIVGQVVVADVVLDGPASEAELRVHCGRLLPEYAVPRRFNFLPEIPLPESLKSHV